MSFPTVRKQRMRTSTNHGKICVGLLLAISLALACFLLAIFRKPSPPQSQLSALKSQTPNLNSQIKDSGSARKASAGRASDLALVKTREPESPAPHRAGQFSELNHYLPAKHRTFNRAENEREEMEEMERELEEARERYDKPDEAARYLLNRRLPEGETELRFE